MYKLKQILLCVIIFSSCRVLALPNDNPNWSPVQKIELSIISDDLSKNRSPLKVQKNQLTEKDLFNNIRLIENLINQALISNQWDLLSDLLLVYKDIPKADSNLYLYAEGALLRAQHEHSKAIRNYEQLLSLNPNLDYVRFDYMALLFENRQLKQAREQVNVLLKRPALKPLHKVIKIYQSAIETAQSWQLDTNLFYEKTDNVNNAAEQKEIHIGNNTFIRNEESLPQSAKGIHYSISLGKMRNLFMNHSLVSKAMLDGIYYWNNKKYNEERIHFQFGYQYQDINRTFRLLPIVGFEWYSGNFYNRKYGVIAQYSQWLTKNWQINTSTARYWRYYVSQSYASIYNGAQNQATAILAWNPIPSFSIYGGGDWSRQRTRDYEESFIRRGIQLGFSYEYQEGIGFSIDTRYGTRDFSTMNFLFPVIRKDKEKQTIIKLWSPKVKWNNIIPKLSYQIIRVSSNIPELYNRKNNQVYLEIEKRF